MVQSYEIKSVLFQIQHNRLYFNKFKERLVHFNGTVVIQRIRYKQVWSQGSSWYVYI